ncbi:uncharacterized protein LOC111263256 isoform X2 [Varroa jacobsoni]|uniref:uncharacterized protein LOC111263256 isoform X2 n=1 Tax=Varroa jacobsoni TaxID=62625 RepID=UPI000BF64CAE|nr:uncharacterized protein LOC111263256 isoform X2 [Varroa jacobsoni]
MDKLRASIENLDRDAISGVIERHIREKSGRNLAGIYKAIRKDTDELGKQSFRVVVFRQMVSAVLRFWFESEVDLVAESLNDLLVELLADVTLLPPADSSGLCETIVDNLGCPMTIELLSSLLLHASSTGVRVLWRATRVADLKTALVQAIVDKAPWKDDFVPYIAKFFREIEPTAAQMTVISPVLAPYISSLPGAQLLRLLGHLLPLHASFLEQVLHRLRPDQLDEVTRAGVLAQCVTAARHNPGIAKSIQTLVKTKPEAILSDAFKFRLCLLAGSIHRTFQGATHGALLRAVTLHCDYELKRLDARWLREALPAYPPLAIVDACILSPSDDRVQLISTCLMDFAFALLASKTSGRVCQQGALMVLNLCNTSSQTGTAQLALDRTLRMHFQNPTNECADLLSKLPCGQLPAAVGWDVISALPSVNPSVARSLVRVILQSCPQVRDELLMCLRKCVFGSDPSSSLVSAKGLLEIVAYFTVDGSDVSQNPNGRLCLEALELVRRLLIGNSRGSTEVRRCLLEGLPELVKENVKLKEAIFELLKDIHTEMPNDPHVLMAISNCLCTYRKTHVKGSPKSRVLKELYRVLCSLVEQGDPTCLDALVRFAAEFGLDPSGIQELIKNGKASGNAGITRTQQQDLNESDSSQASSSVGGSTADRRAKKKKGEKQPLASECLLSNEVLCWLLRTDAVPVEVRIYATDGLAQRKQLEAHERRQLLGALKETLTKPYIDAETRRRCVSLLSANLQAAVGNVFNREDVLEAREELLRDLGVDSRASFFRYLQEMIRQANSDSQRETDLGPLLACVQCLCLLFPDDIELMTDIYTWADKGCTEAGVAYLPLMLDLSSHIEGGLALLRGLSRRLSLLCGLLEDGGRDIETEAFASIHTEDIPVVFALFNTFVRGIIAHLEWVLSKIGLSSEVEPRFIKQLYYVVEALSTVTHSMVPLEQAEGLFQSGARAYKVLASLSKYYCGDREEVSPRYPKLVHFVQKTCTPRFETFIMAVEEESTRRNLGKKKKNQQPKAVPGFVFATEQHHLELNKLAKKIDLGDITTPASARDFKIRVAEVRRQQDEFSDEEIPNSQTVPSTTTGLSIKAKGSAQKLTDAIDQRGRKNVLEQNFKRKNLGGSGEEQMDPPKGRPPKKPRTEEELQKVTKPARAPRTNRRNQISKQEEELEIEDHDLPESIFPPDDETEKPNSSRSESSVVMSSTRISEVSPAVINTPTSASKRSSHTTENDLSPLKKTCRGKSTLSTPASDSLTSRTATNDENRSTRTRKPLRIDNETEKAEEKAASPQRKRRRRTLGIRPR